MIVFLGFPKMIELSTWSLCVEHKQTQQNIEVHETKFQIHVIGLRRFDVF